MEVRKRLFLEMDPRLPIFCILSSYLILGFYFLGFNRTPAQALVTTIVTCSFEFLFKGTFKKRWELPISALITSISLSLLLNYSHNYYVLLVPAFIAIGSKYVLTFNGKHAFNPAQIAVTSCILLFGDMITSAPAYQWNGIEFLWVFMVFLGLIIFHPRIQRHFLVISFLISFTFWTAIRAMVMRHHLPFETLFLGTLTSPSFILFTFFMITDPETSPSDKKGQIKAGMILATLDLMYHLRRSYFTFFFAGSTLQGSRLVMNHVRALKKEGLKDYFTNRFWKSGYYQKPLILLGLAFSARFVYAHAIAPKLEIKNLNFTFQEHKDTGVSTKFGDVFTRVDARIQHMVKWIVSVGDSVAMEDFDQDGNLDLFFTLPLKADGQRNALYRNLGHFKFERVPLPAIEKKSVEVEKNGLPSSGMFVDFDSDGDQDIFITYGFGSPILLKNELKEKGTATFLDVTRDLGLDHYSNATCATFFDANNDGRLDLLVGNTLPTNLPDYPKDKPRKLNLFDLPQPEYEGDERMFNFMHASWHQANNGGLNDFYLQNAEGKFVIQDAPKWGFKDTYWTLSIATADFNHDGFVDLYVANDFGPDEFYYNRGGKFFEKIKGEIFGDISKDTYKGMNASVGDVDRNGYQDVYISNVHHEMQAEGSMLWMFFPREKQSPLYKEMATLTGALNEKRFGWGASFADLNNDGWMDLIQANGMVDDSVDKKFDECPDFWYTNEKIARSSPNIHRYINKWGDIRGYCIYGKEKARIYLNSGEESNVNRFYDVAENVGITETTPSRGVSAGDLDNDGDLDLVISNQFQAPTFYENVATGRVNSWLRIRLESKNVECNRSAVGSRVTVNYSQKGIKNTISQELGIPTGFQGQNPESLHFGLGESPKDVSVDVEWCLKEKTHHQLEKINQEILLTNP